MKPSTPAASHSSTTLIERAVLAVGHVAVDPRLRIRTGHATRTEVGGDAGHVGQRVVDRPRRAGRHHTQGVGIVECHDAIDDASASGRVRNQIQFCSCRVTLVGLPTLT